MAAKRTSRGTTSRRGKKAGRSSTTRRTKRSRRTTRTTPRRRAATSGGTRGRRSASHTTRSAAAQKRNPRVKHRAKTGTRRYSEGAARKVHKVMHEMKHHELHSGRGGKKVTSRKQAIAIGLSEARRAGKKVPKRKAS